MTQHALDFTPRARKSDPLSSHDAATALERAGVAERQLRRAVSLVTQYPGLNTRELAALAHPGDGLARELLHRMLGRRLAEAKDRGLVRPELRDGERMQRWWRVER